MADIMSVSFVVPCWDDVDCLRECLHCLSSLNPRPQIVVADASQDRSLVREMCAEFDVVLVEVTKPNRGKQLDAGAAAAKGKVLVFHHADTEFSQKHYDSLKNLFALDSSVGGGAFLKDLAALYPRLRLFSWPHKLFIMHLGTMYGDQSIFVLRAVFDELGGFRGMPLMEDVSFSARLRDMTIVRVIGPPLRSSDRKFREDGLLRRKTHNLWLIFLFWLGVSPERLVDMYYRNTPSAD